MRKGKGDFLKTCLSSENFCLYVYMNLSVRFENDKEISLVKNIIWVKLLSGSWLCKNQNVKVYHSLLEK